MQVMIPIYITCDSRFNPNLEYFQLVFIFIMLDGFVFS